MNFRALISEVLALIIASSCMQVNIEPEDLSAPEFIKVDYSTTEQLGGYKVVLEAHLSKSGGISDAGFMVGRRVTELYEYHCTLEGSVIRLELIGLKEDTNYLFYAWARNSYCELRTKLYDFYLGTKPEPDPDPSDPSKPRNGHKIAPDLVLYCLRHTYGTDLQHAGVPINIIKYLMGHSDIAVTSNIYVDSGEADALYAASIINPPAKENMPNMQNHMQKTKPNRKNL